MKWGLGLMMVCALGACGELAPETGTARSEGLGADVPMPASCDTLADWDAQDVAFEEEMLRLINEHRVNGSICGEPTHPLELSLALRCAARLHSQDMNERDYYQHMSPEGDGPVERMIAVGYDAGPWGENIFKDPTSPEEAMDGFMESPAHCANIMSPEFSVVGIGVQDTSWTQAFSH